MESGNDVIQLEAYEGNVMAGQTKPLKIEDLLTDTPQVHDVPIYD